jgi:hypothetical protein
MFETTMPPDWPDYAAWHQNNEAQIGCSYDGINFIPPPPAPPAMDEQTLYDAISEVCPIYSVTIIDGTNRSTWSYDPKPQATPTELAAADNVIATIPIKSQRMIATADWIARFTNAEYRAADAATWRQTGGNAKNWDNVLAADQIKLERKKVQTLKADLVAGGVLTQARANEIFS